MNEIKELSNKTITLNRNQYLSVEGDIDKNIYVIESGSLIIFVLDNFEEQIIRIGYTGNIIFALDSFLSNKPTTYYTRAIKKTVLRVISKQEMDAFLKLETNRASWDIILQNLILQLLERQIDILTYSPKERYNRVFKRSPKLFQEVPNRYIANYLRMRPETLSRLKKS